MVYQLKNYGIVLASGVGSRYQGSIPKQFVKIAGKTVMEHTIDIFEKNKQIDEIILVVTPEYRLFVEDIILRNNFNKVRKILNGGKSRKDSSYIAIKSIEDVEANVIIHDCARPFLSQKVIDSCINALKFYEAIDVAIPSADTIIKIKDGYIQNIPNRSELMRGQTPQCFRLSLIKKAHELSFDDDNVTDDCALIVKNNLAQVFVVPGEIENIKITYPSDIFLADRLFQVKSVVQPEEQKLEELKDRVIVVFGGSKGIGQSIVNKAIKYGSKVYVTSFSLGCDVSKYEDVEKYLAEVFEKENKIDYVVNSAGILSIGKLIERSINDIIKDVNVNYMGAINVVKASYKYLKASKGGILLFTSSSYTRGRALYSTYSSTKAGIVNLTQALADELNNDDIRINVMNPERTATPMRFNAFGKEDIGTLLDPEVVAQASLETILSPLTGQVIDVRKK